LRTIFWTFSVKTFSTSRCFRALLAAALAAGMALAQAQERDYAVLRDELPDSLPADQLDIVVIGTPNHCVPSMAPGVGGEVDRSGGTKEQRLVCREALPQLVGTAPTGVRLRLQLIANGSRSVQQEVAQVQGEPLRRYVALVRWDAWLHERAMGLSFEEVVYDREAQRWLWHATRRDQSWMLRGPGHPETLKDAVRVLRDTLLNDLPNAVTRRASTRQGDMPPGARWVPATEVDTWTPGDKAGLVLVEQRTRRVDNVVAPSERLSLRLPGDADRSKSAPEPGSWSHRAKPQTSPAVHSQTYAVLELPAGEYVAKFGTAGFFPLQLAAGEVQVLTTVGAMFASDAKPKLKDMAWFRALKPSLRHAFLADTTPSPLRRMASVTFSEP
jgi:hypothetical protein